MVRRCERCGRRFVRESEGGTCTTTTNGVDPCFRSEIRYLSFDGEVATDGGVPKDNYNADWERTAETAACEHWSLECISSDQDEPWWYDACVIKAIDTSDRFGTIEPGTPVKVKDAKYRIPNDNPRRGRWLIRGRVHQQLLEKDGEYVLCVRRESVGFVATAMRPAWWVTI